MKILIILTIKNRMNLQNIKINGQRPIYKKVTKFRRYLL